MYGLPGQASPFYGLSATHQGPPIYPPIPPSTFYPTGFSPVHTWWVTPLTIIAANPTTMMTTTTMIRRLYKCHSFVLPAVLLVLYTSGVDKCTYCMLYAVGCMLHVVCCMLHVVCCMLHVLCCMLYVVCCMLYVVCCMLYVVCCMFYVACCMLYVASCWPTAIILYHHRDKTV